MAKQLLVLLFAVGVAVSAQTSQPPAPRDANGNRSPQQQSATQGQQPSEIPATPQPPVSINVSVAPSVVTNGPRSEEKGGDGSTAADWWTVWLTGLGTIATIVLVWIAINQFATQTRQTNDALKLAADGLEATREANRQSAEEAARTAERARRDTVVNHPPRLVVRNISVPENHPLAKGRKTIMKDISEDIPLRFWVSNIGGTDALVEEIYSQIIVGPLPMTNPAQDAAGAGMQLRIFSGHSMNVPGHGTIKIDIDDMENSHDLHGVIDGKALVYLIGFIRFRDENGRLRRTLFCRKWDYEQRRFFPVQDPDYNYED